MTVVEKDWNLAWKEQMARHRASDGGRDCVDFWAKASTAKIYAQSAQATQAPRIAMMVEEIASNAPEHVLDIGAGPGILSIPLSKIAGRVTAVEPARGMAERLKAEVAAQKIQNIVCLKKRWEDVDPDRDLEAPYDAVVCSFALGMDDIRAALEKMAAVSSARVYLYWFAGDSSWNIHYKNLYPLLHDRPYEPMPDSALLMKVLEQMGVSFQSSLFSYASQSDFSSLREAVNFYRSRYDVKTPGQETILRDYLDQTLRIENGKRTLDIQAKCMAISFAAGRR